MPYHIDEANSNLTFEVVGNKLIITAPSGGGDGGGGKKTYIITSEDGTVPTDANLFSALRSLEMFLRKDQDDRSKGTIATDKQLEVGRFVSGVSGAVIYVDKATGQTIGELDKLYVRMKAYFEQLEIINVNSVGGKQIISPAGAVRCKSVLTQPDWDYYRCYFLSEQDGNKIENRFKVGDQAYCQMFNAKEGIENNISNRYYCRLVVGVGEDYIDLSKSDCDTYSDEPMPNDVICQRGNRNDIDRQNFIEFSSVDSFSPSITLYQGVNNYSLTDKEVVQFGVNKVTGKSFMNVYGDMYVGNRDGSSFIQYTPENGLILKGTLDINTNFGNKTLKDTINEAGNAYKEDLSSLQSSINKDIDNLQSQIDGAIETWFFDPTPTLTNPPASSWTTGEDKNKHLGDLYYSGEGRAYRFQLNSESGSYYWNEIVDTDINKALENAKKAQDTADGKRRVFVSQPTNSQAYDIGDIWVNAIYPSDGSTYNNDMLRANSKKSEGEPFSIEHWTLASKYTDDTVANKAQEEAAKASKAVAELDNSVRSFKDTVETTFRDGIISESEAQSLDESISQIGALKEQVTKSYDDMSSNSLLIGTTSLTNLSNAKAAFIVSCDDLVSAVKSAISDKNITEAERALVNAKYDVYNTKYGDYNKALSACIRYAEETLNNDISSYNYLKNALKESTTISGGLVQTSAVALGYTNDKNEYIVMAGSNGMINANGNRAPAFWVGGDMVDLFDVYNSSTGAFDRVEGVRYATGLDRMDGTGYRANGKLWWDNDGKVHADPLSFFVGDNSVGGLLSSLQVVFKADGIHPDYLIPKVPFQDIHIANTIRIGDAILKYDSKNKAVYVTHVDGSIDEIGFYADGFVSAKGLSNSQSGGGGASALYQLVDVLANSTNDGVLNAANGSVLMYNGTKWQAGNVVTDISPLTLNVNGSSLFTYDGKSSITANLTVPTKVSQLTNDSGYLTAITKAQVEGVLTGNITSHTHSYLPLSGGTMTGNILAKDIQGADNSNRIIFRHLDGQNCNGDYDLYLQYFQPSGVIYLNGTTYKIYNKGADYNGNAATATNADMLDGNHASAFAAAGHTHSYLPLSGGTLNGSDSILTLSSSTSNSWIYYYVNSGTSKASSGYYDGLAFIANESNYYRIGITDSGNPEYWKGSTSSSTRYALLHSGNFNSYAPTLTGTGASGTWGINISGNAATATKLQTARTITLTGSVTGSVSFDGTSNVSIATSTNHTHSYLPLSGGTMTGNILAKDIQGADNSNRIIFRHLDGQNCDGNYDLYLQYFQPSGVIYLNGTTYKIYNGGANYNGTSAYALNADTVDGYHASSFYQIRDLRSDANSIYDLRWNYGSYDKGDFNGTYKDEYPTDYGTYLSLTRRDNNIGTLMFFDAPTSNILGHIYVRTRGAGDWNTTYSEWGTLAYLTDNVASATKLQTARTIWGQSFDGTANVSGSLSNTGTITASAAATYDIGSNSLDYRYGYFQWIGAKSNTNLRLAANNSDNQIVLHINGNVGIGTNSPSVKLHVIGDIAATGAITAKASSSDIRLKTDITDYKALSIIRGHKSIKYHWNAVAKANADVFNDDYWHYGLIAQDVQKDMPQMVSDVFKDYLVINYERLIPICWKGLQEVDDEVTKLKKKVRKLEMEIRELKQKEDRL